MSGRQPGGQEAAQNPLCGGNCFQPSVQSAECLMGERAVCQLPLTLASSLYIFGCCLVLWIFRSAHLYSHVNKSNAFLLYSTHIHWLFILYKSMGCEAWRQLSGVGRSLYTWVGLYVLSFRRDWIPSRKFKLLLTVGNKPPVFCVFSLPPVLDHLNYHSMVELLKNKTWVLTSLLLQFLCNSG